MFQLFCVSPVFVRCFFGVSAGLGGCSTFPFIHEYYKGSELAHVAVLFFSPKRVRTRILPEYLTHLLLVVELLVVGGSS